MHTRTMAYRDNGIHAGTMARGYAPKSAGILIVDEKHPSQTLTANP